MAFPENEKVVFISPTEYLQKKQKLKIDEQLKNKTENKTRK